MYIYQKPHRFLGQATPAVSATPDYPSQITNFQALVDKKDWKTLADGISALLADANLSINAATLIDPLKSVQTNATTMLTGKGPDLSASITTALTAILKLAQTEALATPSDRIRNEELLSNRISDLNSEITDFQTSNTGYIALWNKISGKEASLYAPIQSDEDGIANDIKITPLTFEGRDRLLKQLGRSTVKASAAWKLVGGSTVIFIGFILFELFKGYATKAAHAGVAWSVGKAKEHAVKKLTKHAKRIKKKFKPSKKKKIEEKKIEETLETPKRRKRKN